MHAYTHAHAYTHVRTCMNAHTHAYTCMHARVHVRTCLYTVTSMHAHTHTHTMCPCTHAHTMHVSMCACLCTCVHACARMYVCTYTHAHTHSTRKWRKADSGARRAPCATRPRGQRAALTLPPTLKGLIRPRKRFSLGERCCRTSCQSTRDALRGLRPAHPSFCRGETEAQRSGCLALATQPGPEGQPSRQHRWAALCSPQGPGPSCPAPAREDGPPGVRPLGPAVSCLSLAHPGCSPAREPSVAQTA